MGFNSGLKGLTLHQPAAAAAAAAVLAVVHRCQICSTELHNMAVLGTALIFRKMLT